MVSCVSLGFLRAFVYLSVEWGDLGLGGTVPFPGDTGSSFSSDRHVKAVCAVLGTWTWPV